jgi:hypothetical protein
LVIKSNNRFSIITICNYETYQNDSTDNRTPDRTTAEQQRNNSGTTAEHNKEDKELKEDKEVCVHARPRCSVKLQVPYHGAEVLTAINQWFDYQAAQGKLPFDLDHAAVQMVQMTATPEELIESVSYGILNTCKNFQNFAAEHALKINGKPGSLKSAETFRERVEALKRK